MATVEALAEDHLERVVLAVRDPEHATAAAALAARGLDTRVIAFKDADATDTHEAAVDAAFAALGDHRSLDLAIVAFAVLGDQEPRQARRRGRGPDRETNFVGAGVSVLTILGERFRRQGRGAIVVRLLGRRRPRPPPRLPLQRYQGRR